MEAFVAGLAAHIFVKATAVIGLAWLITRLCSSLSAAKRHAIWSLALLSLLLMPLAAPVLPGWHVDLTAGFEQVRGRGKEVLQGQSGAMAISEGARDAEGGQDGQSLAALDAARSDRTGGASNRAGTDPWWRGLAWEQWLLWGWAVGVVMILGQLAAGFVSVYRLSRQTEPLETPERRQLIQGLIDEGRISSEVRVAYSRGARVEVPMVWGVVRPLILLPQAARSWTHERLRVVLLHELAHVKRWDYVLHLTAQVVRALFWPNPLVWQAVRAMHIEQEYACDDFVLTAGTASHEYAEHLLDIVRSFQERRSSVHGAAVAMGRAGDIKDRMRALLRGPSDRSPLTFRTGITMALAGGLLIAPVAALHLGPPPDQKPAHGYVRLEAEKASLSVHMTPAADTAASGGQYVRITAENSHLESPPTGQQSTYIFQVPRTATYLVWGRVFSRNDGEDSFWIRVNGGPWVRWNEMGAPGRWAWDDVHDSDRGGEVAAFRLEEGTHTLELAHREQDARIDQLLVTTNWNYKPQGKRPAEAGVEPQRIWLEAEGGWLQSPMETRNDQQAASWQYVEAEKTSRDEPPQGGRALYRFQVAEPGAYYVWGRVLARSDGEDSFWVRMDGGTWIQWNGIEKAPRWIWDQVHAEGSEAGAHAFELTQGTHVLEIAYREEDTKLDRLLLTDSPTFLPRGRGAFPEKTHLRRRLEPEKGRLQAPMQVQADPAASGESVIVVPDGEGNDAPEGGAGYVEIPFSVPQGDRYVIWGRVMAPHENDNSFYVSIDGGEEVVWHTPEADETADEWTWDAVSSGEEDSDPLIYHLDEGRHVLRVRNREDGTLLDQLIITNGHNPQTSPAVLVTMP